MPSVELDRERLADVTVVAGSLDVSNTPLPPFSEAALAFLADLSGTLLRDKGIRRSPDVAAFAYWCRAAQLRGLEQAFRAQDGSAGRIGRGLAFHVTPANVPVNFAFSFAFSLLAGNANIVRVPSRRFAQVETICSAADGLLGAHPEIAARSAFVRYPAASAATEEFSRNADARLIWGGDATIATIGALPKAPRCKDVNFADRYSVAVIDGAAVAGAGAEELERLAEAFYNDTYLMDQNACSSPHTVFWLNADDAAKGRFWAAVRDLAAQRYTLQSQVVMDKYVQLSGDVIRGTSSRRVEFDALLTVVAVDELPHDLCGLRGVGGYFYQADIDRLDRLAPLVNDRYQTVLYHGIDPLLLRGLVIDNRLRGIDRIVPIGKAMDIDIVWDGYDLAMELSRIVDVR
ncbi:MAG: hypothetical protein LBL86_11765 [Coriobacteriales bacterium]|jgi:hypothetical protein|nr:hypothetical protein [Coriobacteriales bacterium]